MGKRATQTTKTETYNVENSTTPQTSAAGNPIHGRLNLLTFITYAILVVLFIGFAGMFVATAAMLVDSFNNKTATYESLRDEISKQNVKIDLLLNQNNPTKK